MEAGTDLVDGIADTLEDLRGAGTGSIWTVYNHVLKLEAFNRLAHQPAILRLMDTSDRRQEYWCTR